MAMGWRPDLPRVLPWPPSSIHAGRDHFMWLVGDLGACTLENDNAMVQVRAHGSGAMMVQVWAHVRLFFGSCSQQASGYAAVKRGGVMYDWGKFRKMVPESELPSGPGTLPNT